MWYMLFLNTRITVRESTKIKDHNRIKFISGIQMQEYQNINIYILYYILMLLNNAQC